MGASSATGKGTGSAVGLKSVKKILRDAFKTLKNGEK